MSDRTSFELEEYKQLFAYIVSCEKAGLQIFVVFVGTSLTVLSLVSRMALIDDATAHETVRYLYLAPVLMNIVFSFLIVSNRRSIRRTGTYIEVFFEEENRGCKWEQRLTEFRGENTHETWDIVPLTYWILFTISAYLFLLNAEFRLEIGGQFRAPTDLLLVAALFLAHALPNRSFRLTGGGGPYERQVRLRWSKIKKHGTVQSPDVKTTSD